MAEEKSAPRRLSEVIEHDRKQRQAERIQRVVKSQQRIARTTRSVDKERRESGRMAYVESIQCMAGTTLRMAKSVNLSETGICLTNIKGLKQGQTLKIYVPLPRAFEKKKRLWMLEGTVTWVKALSAGIKFQGKDEDLLKELRELLWENGIKVQSKDAAPK